MKFLHIADLHIGKKLNEHSLADDQRYILDQILSIARDEKVDGILIAGDVYDKAIPSEDATLIFDDFLTNAGVPVYVISGNHDSADRLSFGNRIFEKYKIHISDKYDGTVPSIEVEDEYGKVVIYLLPFIRIGAVKRMYPDAGIETLDDAIRTVVSQIPINKDKRNVILVHQFVVHGNEKGIIAEESSVGDIDNISSDIFADFDYVALGHLHGAQHIGKEIIRYSGSPLKYSKSEKDQEKSVTIVDLKKKGLVNIQTIPLKPLHDVREITGTIEELLGFGADFAGCTDYIYVTLKGRVDEPNLQQKIAARYPNYLAISFADTLSKDSGNRLTTEEIRVLSPEEIFSRFYLHQKNEPLTTEQEDLVHSIFEEIRGELS